MASKRLLDNESCDVCQAPVSGEARVVAAALLTTGHYDESPDSVEWLRHDATRYAEAVLHADGDPAVALLFVMRDSGLHYEPVDDADARCEQRDIEVVLRSLGIEWDGWPELREA